MFLIVDCYLIQILSCVYAKKSKYYIYEKKNEHIWKVDATLEKVKLKPSRYNPHLKHYAF